MSIFDKSYWLGNKERFTQSPKYDQRQQDELNYALDQGHRYADIEGQDALARKRFNEETIPAIMQRFGTQGASSSLTHQLGRAGSDLEAQLRAMRGQFGERSRALGMTQKFDTYHQNADHGLLGELGPAAIDVAKIWATAGLGAFGGKTKKPGATDEFNYAGIRPGEAGYGDMPDDVMGYQQPGMSQESPMFNQLLNMKQTASPNRSRYTNLFGNNQNQRQPYDTMMDNPILAQLLGGRLGNTSPTTGNYNYRRPNPMNFNNFRGY